MPPPTLWLTPPGLKRRIFIGQGTTAEIFRATCSAAGYQTIIIGPHGLWEDMRGHGMGQPQHLLALPRQPVPAFSIADGQSTAGLRTFTAVETYQGNLRALGRTNDRRDQGRHFDNCTVVRIEEYSPGLLCVVTRNPEMEILAHEMVLATGIGPQRTPQQAGIKVKGTPARTLPYEQIIEGVSYLAAPAPPEKLDVMIYGGGATSAWVADFTLERQPRAFWWLARGTTSATDNPFKGCILPGDRNYLILKRTTGLRQIATVTDLEYLPAVYASGGRQLRRPMVKVTFKPAGGAPAFRLVDQFIYSLGGNQGGPGGLDQLLERSLHASLAPIVDHDRVVSDGHGVLAWATPDRRLLIIGAATYNFQNLRSFQNQSTGHPKQPAPMRTLPSNAQVPDGIAMQVAGIAALNNYIPITQDLTGRVGECTINFNTCDRNALACYLAVFYPDLLPGDADAVVARILVERVQPLDTSGAPRVRDAHMHATAPQLTQGISQERVQWIIRNTTAVWLAVSRNSAAYEALYGGPRAAAPAPPAAAAAAAAAAASSSSSSSSYGGSSSSGTDPHAPGTVVRGKPYAVTPGG